jgi:predicted hotdog family 3-hydroxylacyl-ACP dehydratase
MTRYPPVADLVPHAPPTLALDALLDWRPGHARLLAELRPTSLLVRDGQLDSIAMLELLAQGVAACLGYAAFRGGGLIRVGMVIACRKLELLVTSLPVGERLTVEVDCLRATEDISTYAGRALRADGSLVAQATMTILHAERPPD